MKEFQVKRKIQYSKNSKGVKTPRVSIPLEYLEHLDLNKRPDNIIVELDLKERCIKIR